MTDSIIDVAYYLRGVKGAIDDPACTITARGLFEVITARLAQYAQDNDTDADMFLSIIHNVKE